MIEVIAIFPQVYSQIKSKAGCATLSLAQATCCFIFLLLTQTVSALEGISINVEKISSHDWHLNDVSFSLFDFHNQTQQLASSIKHIVLPEPFSDIKFLDIQCLSFIWEDEEIDCQKGVARLKSERFHSVPFDFSFSITQKQSRFTIKNLKFAKGSLSLSARQEGEDWFVAIKSQAVQLKTIFTLLSDIEVAIEDISSGQINADIKIKGNDNGLNNVAVKVAINQLTLQANQGQIATESLNLELDLVARFNKGVWQWQNSNQIKQGELYIAPVYMEIKDKSLSLNANGLWGEQGDITIHQAMLTHQEVIEISTGSFIIPRATMRPDAAHIEVNIKDLEYFTAQYVTPFVEQTGFEGINLKGQLQAEIELEKNELKQLESHFEKFTLIDAQKRFAIENAEGELNWSVNSDFNMPSFIRWNKLYISAIPIEAGRLKFIAKNKKIKLLEQSGISLLGGIFDIKQFNWQHGADGEPIVYFEGGINNVSLEKLSNALGWTPLSGNISGYIPGVDYQNKTLTLNGGLKVDVFDGTIKINKLALSGLFSDFSRFYMDMEIDKLDLHALTQKFKMGGIEGQLSGFIKNLYLENWQPITFYAWFGTPEDDDSRHRISQKAVENIASVGGGGAADVISKGFLRFFDTFGYDQLGFGCYLHQGVCQLMGVQAADQGYYIIKGGGIPRIDVIGYNPQVDWNVLMKRLARITITDEAVIE